MAGKVLEILLDRVAVRETGLRKDSGRHVVMGSLIWPRPRIAERTAAKTVTFEDNAAELKQARWAERIVWKEVVEGPFALEFAVTGRVTDSQLAQFLRALGASTLKLTGEEAEDMIAGSLAGGMVKVPFKFLSKAISDAGKEGPTVIATGGLDLHSETMWRPADAGKSGMKTAAADESGMSRQFTLPLTAPEAVYRVTRTRREGRLKTRRRKVLEAGTENGAVMFTAKTTG